jgi:hypothetical protein
MIIDAETKAGRFIMAALSDKMAQLQSICDDSDQSEDAIADASNDLGLYRSILEKLAQEQMAGPHPEWVTCGKSIRKLIQELRTFEDQELEVRLSLDSGRMHKPISILSRKDGSCVLENCEWD